MGRLGVVQGFVLCPWVMLLTGLNSDGALGHGPVHLLLKSAANLGFHWNEGSWRWDSLVFTSYLCLLDLSNTFVLHWMSGVIADLCGGRFGVDVILIGMPLCNSSPLLMSER